MAENFSQQRIIDTLPPVLRAKVLDQIVRGDSTRRISRFLLEHGHKVSFHAVAAYKKVEMPKHEAIAKQLQQVQQLTAKSKDDVMSVGEITVARQSADPILDRVQNKYLRYDRWLSAAESVSDFAALSSIDKSETQALRLEAELTGRLVQAANLTQVAIVISKPSEATVEEPVGECIDIRPVHD